MHCKQTETAWRYAIDRPLLSLKIHQHPLDNLYIVCLHYELYHQNYGSALLRSSKSTARHLAQQERERERAEKLKEKNKRAQRKFRQRQKVNQDLHPQFKR